MLLLSASPSFLRDLRVSDGRILELSLDAHHAPRLVDKKKLYRRYIRRHPWMEWTIGSINSSDDFPIAEDYPTVKSLFIEKRLDESKRKDQ